MIFLVIILGIIFIILYEKFRKRIEATIISLVRSQKRVIIDDIIVQTHTSPPKANKIVNRPVSKGILKVVKEDEEPITWVPSTFVYS